MAVFDHRLVSADQTGLREKADTLADAQARIPRNVLSNCVSYAVGILIAFLVAPLLVHHLGNEAYGVWALIGQIIEYSFLLDFGVRIAATRYITRYLALKQPEQINRVMTSGLLLTLLSAVLALGLGVAFACAMPRFFSIPPELLTAARWSVVAIALGISVSFPGSLFSACVVADSRYDLLGVRRVVPGIVRLLLLWVFLVRGAGLVTVAVVTTLAVCVGYGLDFIFALRLFPHLRVRREYFDFSVGKELLNFSLYAFVVSVAYRVIFMTDNIVVGLALGPVAVTYYAIGMQLPATLRDSVGNITVIYAPLAYQMDALDRRRSLLRLFVSGTRVATLCALPGIVGLVILGPRFLGLWMGQSFVGPSGAIAILLSIEVLFSNLSFTSTQVLYAIKRHQANAWLSLGNAGANLVLSIILVRLWGAVGVAWGTVIPAFIVEGILVPNYTARLLRVPPLTFYQSVLLRPALVAAPYGLWIWFCLAHGWVCGYLSLILVLLSGLVVYAVLALRFGLDREERVFARKALSRMNHMFAGAGPAWGPTPGR